MKMFFKFPSIALIGCSLMFASCGDDNDEPTPNPTPDPDPVEDTTPVNPANVFANGVPTQVGDLIITKNAKGLVTKIVDGDDVTTFNYEGSAKAKSRDVVNIPTNYDMTFVVRSDDPDDTEVFTFYITLTDEGFIKYAYEVNTEEGEEPAVDEWWFTYNNLGQMIEMKRSEGDNEVTTITYNADGDITHVSVSDDIDGVNDNTTIAYTDATHSTPILNKSGIMLYDYSLRIDMDEMAPAYFAGLLGKGTAHLPLSAVEKSKDTSYNGEATIATTNYTFTWEFNSSEMPVKFTSIATSIHGVETSVIDLKW